MMWYILTLCQRPPVSMSMFSLPTTVPSTANPNVPYVASNVKNVNNSHLNHHHHTISSLNWRIFLPKWYILLSATSLVISSRLFLPSTVSLTTISHILSVVRHVERIKNSHVNHHHHSTSHPCWRKFQLKWYILMSVNSLVFSSLLFLLFTVLPTTKTIWAKIRQVGYLWKWLSMNIIVIQFRCLWVR